MHYIYDCARLLLWSIQSSLQTDIEYKSALNSFKHNVHKGRDTLNISKIF